MTIAPRHCHDPSDRRFVEDFERCAIPAERFDHRAHLRLAYFCLCGDSVDAAHRRIRSALERFLAHIGAPPDKYHETMTRAWIMAVDHFMRHTMPCSSAAGFIERNPVLLDRSIMRSHYSPKVLFSDAARTGFVEPDLQTIPPG